MITENATTKDGDLMSFAAAVRQLKLTQKPSLGAPAYSVYINRPAGRYLAAAAYQLKMTPNMVSCVSAAFSFVAIAVLALVPPSFGTALVVALGLAIGYALDSADGQLARLRGGGSALGEWLDHMIDATKISTLHLAVLISMFRYFDLPSVSWLLVPIGYSAVAAVMFFGMILIDQLRKSHGVVKAVQPAGPGTRSPLRSLLVSPTDYGIVCLIFILLAWPTAFLVVYTVMFVGNGLFLLLASLRWYREMSALGAPDKGGKRS